jgi:hypothetical protein
VCVIKSNWLCLTTARKTWLLCGQISLVLKKYILFIWFFFFFCFVCLFSFRHRRRRTVFRWMNRWRAWITPLQQLYYSLAIHTRRGRPDQDVTQVSTCAQICVLCEECVCACVCVGATSLGPFYYIVIVVCESFPPIGFSATADRHHPPGHPRHHLDEFAQHNYTRLEIQRIEITITNNKQNEKKMIEDCESSYFLRPLVLVHWRRRRPANERIFTDCVIIRGLNHYQQTCAVYM